MVADHLEPHAIAVDRRDLPPQRKRALEMRDARVAARPADGDG